MGNCKSFFLALMFMSLFFGSHPLLAQRKIELDSSRLDRADRLKRLQGLVSRNNDLLGIYAQRYGFLHPDNPNPPESESKFLLYDLGPNGRPVFIHTHELRSNLMHRSDRVQPLGSNGLRLNGRGQVVGVFDEGRIQVEHQEFGGRVQMQDQVQGNNFHSTHVTGIIAAAGVNPDAIGMAPEVQVKGYSFNEWDTKLIEVVEGDQFFISNHSYGPATGWIRDDSFPLRWRWFGDTAISATEDYTFGYYSGWSQFHDAVVDFAPYHVFVTSAGNSRNQNGPASPFTHEYFNDQTNSWTRSTIQRQPNGPYDSTPMSGTAKNIITVGAVSGSTAEDFFSMASFSSWGPTDDGRIKPDVVGVGVNVLSTLEDTNGESNRYGNLQGTSMSSPNVAGGVALLRQHFTQQLSYLPLASTLKGLVIHSARQRSGAYNGPEYRFGWGLMDVETAANLINKLDSTSVIILEDVLETGKVYETSIQSDGDHPMKITLAWTDIPGEVPEPSLNPRDTILVNDLDLVVIDPNGNEFLPWVLDPANPANEPTKGVNSLDNVEQVVIEEPIAGTYTIRISHKKAALEDRDFQIFSLLGHAKSLSSDVGNLYWIGGSGDWHDPEHWSESPNGESAGRIPSANDNVRFLSSSFSSNEDIITFSQEAVCLDFVFESDSLAVFDPSGFSLTVQGSLYLEKEARFQEGLVKLSGQRLRVNGFRNRSSNLSDLDILLESGESIYEIEDTLRVRSIHVANGLLDLSNKVIETESLIVGSEQGIYGISLRNAKLSIKGAMTVDTTRLEAFIADGSSLSFQQSTGADYRLEAPGLILNNVEVKDAGIQLAASTAIRKLVLEESRALSLEGNALFDSLVVDANTFISFAADAELSTSFLVAADNNFDGMILSGTAGSPGVLNLLRPFKLCFTNARIQDVRAVGEGSANAGESGQLSGDTEGWFATTCDKVLFADFNVQLPCLEGTTSFINASTGNIIERYTWVLQDSEGNEIASFNEENPEYRFDQAGTYSIRLTIEENGISKQNSRQFEVVENPLRDIILFEDGNQLAASLPNLQYIWFKDGEALLGENGRFLTPQGPGEYQVLVSNGTCSFLSPAYLIEDEVVSIEEDLSRYGFTFYPNPLENDLILLLKSSYRGEVDLRLQSLNGTSLGDWNFIKEEDVHYQTLDLRSLSTGMYIITIEFKDRSFSRRVLKK
jgi:hypothetical protein